MAISVLPLDNPPQFNAAFPDDIRIGLSRNAREALVKFISRLPANRRSYSDMNDDEIAQIEIFFSIIKQ